MIIRNLIIRNVRPSGIELHLVMVYLLLLWKAPFRDGESEIFVVDVSTRSYRNSPGSNQ